MLPSDVSRRSYIRGQDRKANFFRKSLYIRRHRLIQTLSLLRGTPVKWSNEMAYLPLIHRHRPSIDNGVHSCISCLPRPSRRTSSNWRFLSQSCSRSIMMHLCNQVVGLCRHARYRAGTQPSARVVFLQSPHNLQPVIRTTRSI